MGGAKRPRKTLHEGLDFAKFQDASGTCFPLGRQALQTIEAGVVVHVMDDFLGQTAVLRRVCPNAETEGHTQLYWMYAHLALDPVVQLGAQMEAGSMIGRAAVSKTTCPEHLHVS